MQIVYEVLMDTGRVLALLLVSFALCVSILILLKPRWASALNRRFNALYNPEDRLKQLDRRVATTEMVMRNRLWVGPLFLIGSFIVLAYAVNVFDPQKFIYYVIRPASRTQVLLSDIFTVSLQWLFIIVSTVGIATAVLILFSPETFRSLSDKLDRMFSTEETIESLEAMNSSLDSWVLRHHVLVGAFLFLGSVYLTRLCFRLFVG
ncbi:MAG: hypothetical protein KC553_01820 [Nitrospina sp.]|nr:hypothetical protein [Nitrospina sp.]